MIVWTGWMDYLFTFLVLVIAVQFGILLGIKLEERYGA